MVYLTAASAERSLSDANELLLQSSITSGASDCDDTPMFHVPLPFTFPYAGGRYQHIYLNPNGMIFFEPRPPCEAYFSAGPPCSFGSAPFGPYAGYVTFIAPFATDFNPADSPESVIEHASTPDKVLVRWRNLNMFGSSWRGFTFTAELRRSGHVRVHLTSMQHPEDVSDAPGWVISEGSLVGLRFGEPFRNRTLVTMAQRAARSTWLETTDSLGTAGVDGVYMDRALVANHTLLDFCPMPTKLCPIARAVPAGGTLVLASASTWGCDDDVFAFRCLLTGASTSLSVNATVALGGSSSVECTLPLDLPPAVYEVSLLFRHRSDQPVTPVGWSPAEGLDSVQVEVLPAVQPPEGSCSGGGDACDECGVCGGAGGCVGCDGLTAFADYDCKGACDGSQGLWLKDKFGTCCEAVNGTDCLGVCGGTYRQGWVSDRSYMVCCKNVDCAGYCNGKAVVDSWYGLRRPP